MWDSSVKDLGVVKEGSKNIITFAYNGENKIARIALSCGCIKTNFNKKKGILKVIFKPNPIPVHLIAQGYYDSSKQLIVYYETGERELLHIKAKVIPK